MCLEIIMLISLITGSPADTDLIAVADGVIIMKTIPTDVVSVWSVNEHTGAVCVLPSVMS